MGHIVGGLLIKLCSDVQFSYLIWLVCDLNFKISAYCTSCKTVYNKCIYYIRQSCWCVTEQIDNTIALTYTSNSRRKAKWR